MKVTKSYIKQLVKEELNKVLDENLDAGFANQRGENHMMQIGKERASLSSKHIDKPYVIKKGQQPYWGMIQKAASGDKFSIEALRKDAGITDDLPLEFVQV
tara:strand:+ start:6035 stop:6337 length:303 start_codon:yes stop_codon:yes gene_type:complete